MYELVRKSMANLVNKEFSIQWENQIQKNFKKNQIKMKTD